MQICCKILVTSVHSSVYHRFIISKDDSVNNTVQAAVSLPITVYFWSEAALNSTLWKFTNYMQNEQHGEAEKKAVLIANVMNIQLIVGHCVKFLYSDNVQRVIMLSEILDFIR